MRLVWELLVDHEKSTFKYLEMAFRVNEYNNVVFCFLISKLLISRNFQILILCRRRHVEILECGITCAIKYHFDNRMQRKPPKLRQFLDMIFQEN